MSHNMHGDDVVFRRNLSREKSEILALLTTRNNKQLSIHLSRAVNGNGFICYMFFDLLICTSSLFLLFVPVVSCCCCCCCCCCCLRSLQSSDFASEAEDMRASRTSS